MRTYAFFQCPDIAEPSDREHFLTYRTRAWSQTAAREARVRTRLTLGLGATQDLFDVVSLLV